MKLNKIKLILGISALTIAIPSFVLFTYYTLLDWYFLDNVTQEIMKNKDKISERKMNYLLSRELSHRINVTATGTWTLMTAIIGLQAVSLITTNDDKS
ncbi:hypothetical protein WH8501_17485 [Crocosphaera watsonii WH 8501]|uniref:Uncharacterized protein n=1 Tax=Crocosphaera watsonii WH 8501 TaxID=165597 RepID=Q4C7J3_CROWT|nr:hypothetical protein [Crocosphaera watsonii]EAM52628.1 hypothetical protein CwatDRAFT_5584 [Crocosphaera watsonii WH 8501]